MVQGFQALTVPSGATRAPSLMLTELCWAQAWLNPSHDQDLRQPKSTAEQNSGSHGKGVEFRGSSRGVAGEEW